MGFSTLHHSHPWFSQGFPRVCRELSKPLLRASSPLSTLAGAGAEERRSLPLKLWTFIQIQARCAFVSWCALMLHSCSMLHNCSRRCFKRSVLHALLRFTLLHKSHGDVLFTSRRCLCASRRYFALTKAVLHASCSSRRCCVLFKTLLHASRLTCSKLQATTTSHSY